MLYLPVCQAPALSRKLIHPTLMNPISPCTSPSCKYISTASSVRTALPADSTYSAIPHPDNRPAINKYLATARCSGEGAAMRAVCRSCVIQPVYTKTVNKYIAADLGYSSSPTMRAAGQPRIADTCSGITLSAYRRHKNHLNSDIYWHP